MPVYLDQEQEICDIIDRLGGEPAAIQVPESGACGRIAPTFAHLEHTLLYPAQKGLLRATTEFGIVHLLRQCFPLKPRRSYTRYTKCKTLESISVEHGFCILRISFL